MVDNKNKLDNNNCSCLGGEFIVLEVTAWFLAIILSVPLLYIAYDYIKIPDARSKQDIHSSACLQAVEAVRKER